MAQPIKKSDIVENDILQELINEFERASVVNKQFNEGLKESAKLLKGGLNKIDFTSTESLTQANIRLKEANQLFKQKLELEKANKQNAIAEEKLRQQQIKTQEQLNKQAEREIKNQTKLESIYARVNDKLSKTRKEYRDLAIRKELGLKLSNDEEKSLLRLEKRIQLYNNALVKTDERMGNHHRKIGNYANAWNGLGNSVNQLTREMPAFANSMQTGFMAISNNLPMFFDEIQKIKKENANLAAEGKKTTSVLSQLGASIFSWGTALNVGVTLLTVYGAKLVEYLYSLTGAAEKEKKHKEEIEKKNKALKRSREEIKKQTESIGSESAKYVGLIETLKATNKNSKERLDLINEINKQYGTSLQNLSDEDMFQKQLNKSVTDYISLKRLEFRLKANEEYISKGIAKQEKLRLEALKLSIPISKQVLKDILDGKKALSELTFDRFLSKDETIALNRFEAIVGETKTINENLTKWGLNMSNIKNDINELDFDESKRNLEQIVDLTRQIEDEANKRIQNELKRSIIELRINAERRIEDLKDVKATEEQKKRLTEEIMQTLYYDLTKLYDDYYSKEIEAYQKNLDEKKKRQEQFKQIQEEWDKDVLSQLDDFYTEKETIEINNTENTNEVLKEIELKNNIQKLKDKLSYLQKDRELHKSEIIKTENELAKLERDYLDRLNQDQLDLQAEYDEQEKKALKDKYDFRRQLVHESANFFIEQSEKKIAQLDKEIAKHEQTYSTLQELAKQGNIQAKESLAVEQQQIVEANKKKAEEQKRMQRIKLAESAYTAYSNNVEKGEKNPLLKTITDMTLLRQFISSLPAFEKGTEDTGTNGKGVDGKGGFISILHPNERVMTKEQNAMLGGLKNDEVAETIAKYRSGQLVQFEGANALNTNWQTSLLISEIKDLKQIIKDKPETSIEAGKIIQGTMEIVETRRQGNTIRRNKYIV